MQSRLKTMPLELMEIFDLPLKFFEAVTKRILRGRVMEFSQLEVLEMNSKFY